MQNQILGFSASIRLKETRSVYYLLTFLFEFAAGLTFATYVLFLLSKGLDVFQVMLVNLAFMIAGLIGGYLGSVNLALPFGAGAVVAFTSLLISIFFIKEGFIQRRALNLAGSLNQIGKVAKDSITYGIKHKVVFWLMISSILATFAFQPLNMYWSPRMNELAGNKIWLMGWVWAGMSLFMMLGGFVVRELLKRQKSYSWIMITTALILAVPILLSSLSNIFALVLISFLIYEVGRGMLTPAHKAYLNKHIPSEQRATVLSFDSMMGKFGASLGLVILGLIAKNYSIQISWLVSGLLLFLLIPIYIKARKQERLS